MALSSPYPFFGRWGEHTRHKYKFARAYGRWFVRIDTTELWNPNAIAQEMVLVHEDIRKLQDVCRRVGRVSPNANPLEVIRDWNNECRIEDALKERTQ